MPQHFLAFGFGAGKLRSTPERPGLSHRHSPPHPLSICFRPSLFPLVFSSSVSVSVSPPSFIPLCRPSVSRMLLFGATASAQSALSMTAAQLCLLPLSLFQTTSTIAWPPPHTEQNTLGHTTNTRSHTRTSCSRRAQRHSIYLALPVWTLAHLSSWNDSVLEHTRYVCRSAQAHAVLLTLSCASL
jgi:hypothetical protein